MVMMGKALILLLFVALLPPRLAHAVELRVRGTSQLEVIAAGRAADVLVRGALTDEVGASLGRASLRLEAKDGGSSLALEGLTSCPGEDTLIRSDGRNAANITTDERGVFCVLWPGRTTAASFTVKYNGNKFFEGFEASATVIPEGEQRAATSLKFDSPPSSIELDKESHLIGATLRIARADAARMRLPSTRHEGLTVNLVDERGQIVATTTTRGDGKARFEVKSSALADPGDGELRAEFAGDKQLAPSRAESQVTRSVKVSLELPTSAVGDPDAGIAVEVKVVSARGPAASGLVEASIDDKPVGAAPVKDGKASLMVTFAGGQERKLPLTVRYSPSAPYWQPGAPATMELVAKGPHPVRQIGLALLGAALVAWIVLKWRRAPKVENRDSAMPPPPSGRPEILVLERPSGLRGWKGQVADAHDGHPIARAQLTVFTLGFDKRNVIARATTEADGTFALEVSEVPKDARLLVEGDLHATYEQPLPGPSILRVALVTRRRAMLDRLVKWARLRGTPFDSNREPTPGHVRRVASRTGAERVESWATRLEAAAFGPGAVTREVEEGINGSEPSGAAEVRPVAGEDAPNGPH